MRETNRPGGGEMLGRKGQLTVDNLVALLVMIMIIGIMFPVLYPFIDQAANATNDTVTQTLIYILPAGIVLGAFLVIFRYTRPYYSNPPM